MKLPWLRQIIFNRVVISTKSRLGTHGEMACLMKNIHIFYRLNANLQHFKICLDTFEQIQPFEGKI